MTEFEQKILDELQNLRAEISALRSDYSVLQSTYFENLPNDSIVGIDYAAWKFNCPESAVMRGRFNTYLIPRFRQKPLAFIKREVDAIFKSLTKNPSETAAEIRFRVNGKNNRRTQKHL